MTTGGYAAAIGAVIVGAALLAGGVAAWRTPARADLRPAFARAGLDVRVQGDRGTCSVFTLTDAVEYALARTGPPVRLSPEFLNWAANDAQGGGARHDGGFFADLWRGVALHGACLEEELPYAPAFDPHLRPSPQALASARRVRDANLQLRWIKAWDARTGLAAAQLAQIKATLDAGWPVCGGFRWPKQQRFAEGVLQMATPDEVFDGHSVLLVGYRDDPLQPGGGVLLFRNSADGRDDREMSYAYALAYTNDAAWVERAP